MLCLFVFLVCLAFTFGADYYTRSSQFHPTGRILATEHAKQVVAEKGGPVCAIKCKDGILLSASKRIRPNSLTACKAQKVFYIDRHITIAVSGFVFQSNRCISNARRMCAEHRQIYASPIPIDKLCDLLANDLHKYTREGQNTPSISLVVCGWDEDGPQVFSVDPEGSSRGWHAVAIGANSNLLLEQLAHIVTEENPIRTAGNNLDTNTVNKVWPKFKKRILQKYFHNAIAEDTVQTNVKSGDSDELDWGGGLPGGAGEWSTEVYSCLKASTGEVCWTQVAD